MAIFEPYALPTAVGSLPHADPKLACSLVLKYLPQIPAWPQLPKRDFREGMFVQFLSDFPGVRVEEGRIYLDTSAMELNGYLEKLERGRIEEFAIPKENALGLYTFLESELGSPLLLKGHITGPVSYGLGIVDEERCPIIYNDIVAETLAKHLKLKASWQEKELRRRHPHTMLWVDEPYLVLLDSSFVSLPQEKVKGLLTEVLSGISGLKGIHCCGNADWPLVLSLPIDVVNFDAYNFPDKFTLYPEEVGAFLDRGGIIAWGIVPTDEGELNKETPAQLKDRLEETMAHFTRKGIHFKKLLAQSLLTPACGLGNNSIEGAEKALELLWELSQRLRQRYKP